MNKIAIITARGGSKRIPYKNIREFCGKPIITYSIKAALESEIFDEVMVSTDDEQICEISKKEGAIVPFIRSKENADDLATTADVLKEVIGQYDKMGKHFEHACCIYPTAPFITPQKLKFGMELLKQENADTVMPVVRFSFPPQRGMRICNECLSFINKQNIDRRSQDLEPIYHDAGQFYCFNVKSFLTYGNLVKGSVVPIILDELEVQDIDHESDWKIAEMKYTVLKGAVNQE